MTGKFVSLVLMCEALLFYFYTIMIVFSTMVSSDDELVPLYKPYANRRIPQISTNPSFMSTALTIVISYKVNI